MAVLKSEERMNCDGWSMRDRRSQEKDTRESLRRHRKRCPTIYPFTVTFYSPRGGWIRYDGDLNRGRPRHTQGILRDGEALNVTGWRVLYLKTRSFQIRQDMMGDLWCGSLRD
jgi:hypothetical protein